MLVFPNAKINIGLSILEKRTDGFHNIESVFYPVGWRDALEIVPSENFHFETTGLPIPGDSASNLLIKALDLLEASTGRSLRQISMQLHKLIPMGAGLGGGSADGAFALKALNELFSLKLSVADLQHLARKLGSDCAFFIENKPAFCFNKGDEFQETEVSLAGKTIVLIYPNFHISTAEAYGGVTPKKPAVSLLEALQQPISEWKNHVINDFEAHLQVKYPLIQAIKSELYALGATYASMTGSGSTVYGIFEAPVTLPPQLQNYSVWQGVMQ